MLASLLLLAAVAAENPKAWEEVSDDDGIRVWAREVPGSDIREIKAEAVIDSPAARVWEVLADTAHYVEFMPYVIEARIISKDDGGQIEYQRIDPPMVDMRDYTVRVVLEADADAGRFKRSWSSANDKGPAPRADTVRVETNQGAWTIVAVSPGQARLSYYLFTDPGGSIPTFITNKANTKSIPDLMRAVRSRSRDPKWTRDE